MSTVLISGSKVGSKTRTAMEAVRKTIETNYPDEEVTLLDLSEFDLVFSDGRDYREYKGDTKIVTEAVMAADTLIIGTPIFQASIPGSLKNVFDLLPQDGLREKVASIVVTAGSVKHFLIAETQLKPILSYMKAQIVQDYLFIEEKDFFRKEIVNDDVHFRIERLIENTYLLSGTYKKMLQETEDAYDF
ncbi:NADPH-dependent FMN reductase [Alkalibacterium sp.]|nr:MAG: NAD(P)H-dependent oxidoreductase [Alkalibacterium sp.]